MYKKKSLKFTYEKYSRDTRHAETLKARESSRFKRLSTIRSIEDSDLHCNEMEKINKIVESEGQKIKKQPLSRLEMLFKWKQEKQLKKDLEMKEKKKPFYVGGQSTANKNLQLMKTSVVAKSNTSFSTSNPVKSKLAGTPNLLQTNKASKFKQMPVSSQTSRIPNTSKQVTPSTAFHSSRIPDSKRINPVLKSVNAPSNASACPKKPLKPVSKSAALNINQMTSVSKGSLKNVPNKANVVKPNSSLKPVDKGPSQLKPLSKIPNKMASKIGVGIPKPVSTVSSISKRIPTKMPVTSTTQKSTAHVKVQQKEPTCFVEKEQRKGYSFKKAITNVHKQQNGTSKTVSNHTEIKKFEINANKDKEIKTTKAESLLEQDLKKFQDITFNSDISMIKQPSFAPENFRFQPPAGLADFIFDDDDDDDPYEALGQIALKFMSRTSTPSKGAERSSGPKSTNESSTAPSNESTCNTVEVSNLISPKVSSEVEIAVKKEISNDCVQQKSCDVLSDIVIETETDDTAYNEPLESLFDIEELTNNSDKHAAEGCSVNINQKVESSENQLSTSFKNETTCNTSIENLCDIITETADTACNKPSESSFGLQALSKNSDKNDTTVGCSININQKVKDSENQLSISFKNETTCNTSIENSSNRVTETADTACSEPLRSSFDIQALSKNSDKNDATEGCSVNINQEIKDSENQLSASFMNETTCDALIENISLDDSLLDTSVLTKVREMVENKFQKMKLEDEGINKTSSSEDPEALVHAGCKPPGVISKRVSILKSSSNLNAIAEISEDENISLTPSKFSKEQKDFVFTPRRSKRISGQQHVSDDHGKNDVDSPVDALSATPRRSMRLQKASVAKSDDKKCPILSPLEEKKVIPRRSMRLINLNTPEKDGRQRSKLCMPTDFENLMDTENIDPNNFLVDSESPEIVKSKKVSLLYTPEKNRKSFRKSIRGDLMSFSPAS